MKELIVKFSEELASAPKEQQSAALDAEVERFSKWLESEVPDLRARGALTNPERMLLKTYLVQKITGKLDR